ncbi:MAG TPA: Re/Si-specific NAD(P)(+) transhydrogenase subunit alpha [Gemmatimonadales bacterium]|nr:Re/Si-specific NAD(P)(+) transhydrogenase subunit alpha [Gemmatimonadales bacterium]
MKIAVPRETAPGERRVALVPDSVARLRKGGHELFVEAGAGTAAGFTDEAYAAAGATLATAAGDADLVAKVQAPSAEEAERLRTGAALVSFLNPGSNAALLAQLAERGVSAFAMELVPRTTKAQSMDALSSQATVAGYKAVLLGAGALPRFLPMLTTAAGTIPPARVFVIGAGVAGLQAIATARRLGAVVSAFDVRPAVREQVQSLGATFVDADAVTADAEGKGGYARELGEDQQRRVSDAVARHIRDMDLVITTAQIPGRPAPRIVTDAMLAAMRPGSIVVDLAAESGGNCEGTVAGQTVERHGVSLMGPVNLAATLPYHASQMYSRNVQTFIEYATRDGAFTFTADDPIAGPMSVVHGGAVLTGS